MNSRSRLLPAAGAYLLFLVVLAALIVRALVLCGGHFGYPMDDTYIHMAMAKNFALHGVWGVTRYGFTSSTSSPLYTLLLAGCYAITGVREATPLILNILVAGAVLFWCNFVLARVGFRLRPRIGLLALLVFAVPLPILALGGMEHVLHTLLTLIFVHACCIAIPASELRPTNLAILLGLAAVLVMARYEGAFLIAIAGGLFLLRGKWPVTLGLAAASLIPLAAYGWISVRHGWSWVPNSLLLKANLPSANSAGMYPANFLSGLIRSWSRGAHVVALILIALVLLRLLAQKNNGVWSYSGTGLILFASAAVLHLLFARTGWFFRYEAYLVALGIIVIAVAIQDLTPIRSPLLIYVLAGIFLLLATARTSLSFWVAAQSIADIHDQQYQMGLFVKQNFAGKTVLLNDIGAVSFLSDARILDAIGLGSMAPATARRTRAYSNEWLVRWAAENKADLAILYPNLSPPAWRPVAKWTIPGNYMSGSDTVCFFAVNPSIKPELAAQLAAFRSQLPRRVLVGP